MKPISKRAVPVPEWLRVVREPDPYRAEGVAVQVKTPEDVVRYLRPMLEVEEVELFVVLALDSKSRIRGCQVVTRGLLDSSLVHPREVFRLALVLGAAGIIVAHNHPSGDPTPSAEDRSITRQLVAAGSVVDVPVYDHVIVAGDRWTSFATLGLL